MKCLAFVVLALAAPAINTPADIYRQAQAAVAKQDDGFGLDANAPDGPALLRNRYRAIQVWAADWMSRHPDAALGDLTTAAANLDNDLDLTAERLDTHSVLVQAHRWEVGNVFILSDRTGHYAVAWDIAAHGGDRSTRNGAKLAAWAPERAKDNCRANLPNEAWGTCGPLYAAIKALPSMHSGIRRFYIDAGYAQQAGATISDQFSVWTWDGVNARPILVQTYASMADQNGPSLANGAIHIPAKGFFKQLFACGACVGREMRIVIDLNAPNGAKLTAKRSLTPELDAIDELYDRVLNGKSADALAVPKVLAQIKAEVKGAKPDDPIAGMIMSWKPVGRPGERVVCLNADNIIGPHLFTFIRERGRLKIVDVRLTTSQCDGPGARS